MIDDLTDLMTDDMTGDMTVEVLVLSPALYHKVTTSENSNFTPNSNLPAF